MLAVLMVAACTERSPPVVAAPATATSAVVSSPSTNPTITPAGLEVLAASPLTCGGRRHQQVMAYRSTPSGSGVFATGTVDWGCGLDGTCPGIARFEVVRGVTENVLRAFAAGPAGRTHPSTDNASSYRR